jgi:hypothetical protein
MKRGSWKVLRYTIDGLELERWFLKTLINLSYNRSYPIGSASKAAGKPADDLVEIALGQRAFIRRAGLYSVMQTGVEFYSDDSVYFVPVIKDQVRIGGGLFEFRGFRFALFLEPEGVRDQLTGLGVNGQDWGRSQLNFHNQQIKDFREKYLSQVIMINW